ncbi:MAG: stage V sporulation protein AB [Lachnospiraceae bacterium]|nr:stage V sporulation protein AB [Lachnospiraceae bacterium]
MEIWEIGKLIGLGFCGLCYGFLSSAGVFTVLVTVSLVPRFAGRTHTGVYAKRYEDMIVLGTISGGLLTVFEKYIGLGEWWISFCTKYWEPGIMLGQYAGYMIQVIFGLGCGIFIGCLALAIAEMLDSIPIFFRRVGFGGGVSRVILAVALGKVTGSLLFFYWEFVGR